MSKKISLKQFLMGTGRFEKAYDSVSAINGGKITINGKVITNPNHFFNPKTSLVKFSGEKIRQIAKISKRIDAKHSQKIKPFFFLSDIYPYRHSTGNNDKKQ